MQITFLDCSHCNVAMGLGGGGGSRSAQKELNS